MDDDTISNPTDNESFQEVLGRRMKRRSVLKAAGAVGSLLVLHQALPGGVTGPAAEIAETVTGGVKTAEAALTPLNFASIAHNLDDKVTVPPGYQAQVLLRWGDAIMPDAQGFSQDNPCKRRSSRSSASATTQTSSPTCRCPTIRRRTRTVACSG